jgi:hypothetical protein
MDIRKANITLFETPKMLEFVIFCVYKLFSTKMYTLV